MEACNTVHSRVWIGAVHPSGKHFVRPAFCHLRMHDKCRPHDTKERILKLQPTHVGTLTVRRQSNRVKVRDYWWLTFSQRWAAFCNRWKKAYGKMPPFVAVLEMHESGWPHLHFVCRIEGNPPTKEELKRWWCAVGGGWRSELEPLTTDGQYIAKYLDKGSKLPAEIHGLLMANKIRMIYSSKGLKTEKVSEWSYKRGTMKEVESWIGKIMDAKETYGDCDKRHKRGWK